MRVPLLLLAAVAALLVGVVAAPVSAKTSKTVKPCQLLTPGQVATVVGEPVNAGKPMKVAAKATSECLFTTATPGLLFILQVTQGPTAKPSYAAGRSSLPSHPLSGIGQKAYQVDETSSIGFLDKDFYVILQPPGTIAKARDLSKLPALAKTTVQALKAWG